MIYLDSSAVLKLLVEEAESEDLEAWSGESGRSSRMVSSTLTRVEVLRACRRVDESLLSTAGSLLDRLDLLPLDETVVGVAAQVPPPQLRSLDALHLSSALQLGDDIEAFVVYDTRLADAARALGLPVVQPGR